MIRWNLATKAVTLGISSALTIGIAPSYAGNFTGNYGFGTLIPPATTTTANVTPGEPVTFSSFVGDGIVNGNSTGRTGPSDSGYFGTGWTSAFDPNKYFRFNVAAASGTQMNITGFQFDSRRLAGLVGSAAPRQWALRSSLDNFSTNLLSGVLSATGNLPNSGWETITQGLALNNVTGTVFFRLYGFDAANAAGTWQVDNVILSGVTTAVPTPAIAPAMVGFGIGLWRKRKQRSATGV
jgi:hypothetical protein